jgi:predicted Rdx family selenoprotein
MFSLKATSIQYLYGCKYGMIAGNMSQELLLTSNDSTTAEPLEFTAINHPKLVGQARNKGRM